MAIFVSVDVGGTFTDLLAFDSTQSSLISSKVLTTPDDPTVGIVECLSKAHVELHETAQLRHGTTLVINTALERTGSRAALVTTRGFRDILDIGRGNRPEGYNVLYQRPAPLIPREHRFEVNERIAADGRVVISLSESDIETIAQELIAQGFEAVAVCFLNSYQNPDHENTASKTLRKHPLFVSVSTEISREWREYERTSTAVLNAYVGPRCRRYLATLGAFLEQKHFQGRFLIMQSNGGTMSADVASSRPVFLMESGPVAGVTGAAALGQVVGLTNIVSFDMGGTTAKAALVETGRPSFSSTYYVGGYAKGYPIQIEVVDIVEVGAGGGSIAWVDESGFLKVGPRSAGALPGPACYNLGGAQPTITDANLVLGRLTPGRLRGVDLELRRDLAIKAVERDLAVPLGLSVEETCAGIIEIANVTMSTAVRRVSIERGRDPRDFAMVGFGGAGPIHATAIARELGIPTVLIPPLPGHFSALGLLLSNPRYDLSRTWVIPFAHLDLTEAAATIEQMINDTTSRLRQDIPEIADVMVQSFADLRYIGQYHTIRIPFLTPPQRIDKGSLAKAFHAAYSQRYGHADEGAPIELVALRVVVDGALPRPDLLHTTITTAAGDGIGPVRRKVYFESVRGFREAWVYQRETLRTGQHVEGPAVLEEHGSTCVLQPGDVGVVGDGGLLAISVENRTAEQ